jgi:hypothetical protein
LKASFENGFLLYRLKGCKTGRIKARERGGETERGTERGREGGERRREEEEEEEERERKMLVPGLFRSTSLKYVLVN